MKGIRNWTIAIIERECQDGGWTAMESLSVFICPISQLRWWCRGSRKNSHCEAETHGLPKIDIADLAHYIIAFVVTRH
jgi:hypothetical protein